MSSGGRQVGGLRKGNRWEREGESAQSRASKGLQAASVAGKPSCSSELPPGPTPQGPRLPSSLWHPLLFQPWSKLASPVSSKSSPFVDL